MRVQEIRLPELATKVFIDNIHDKQINIQLGENDCPKLFFLICIDLVLKGIIMLSTNNENNSVLLDDVSYEIIHSVVGKMKNIGVVTNIVVSPNENANRHNVMQYLSDKIRTLYNILDEQDNYLNLYEYSLTIELMKFTCHISFDYIRTF